MSGADHVRAMSQLHAAQILRDARFVQMYGMSRIALNYGLSAVFRSKFVRDVHRVQIPVMSPLHRGKFLARCPSVQVRGMSWLRTSFVGCYVRADS